MHHDNFSNISELLAPGGTSGRRSQVRRLRHEAGMAHHCSAGVECRFNLVFTGDVLARDAEALANMRKSGLSVRVVSLYRSEKTVAAIVEPSLTVGYRVRDFQR